MNSLLETYRSVIRHHHLQNKKLLLAVSGGLDSVVLTHLSQAAGLDFVIAHCNFQLRGDESFRDEEFVRVLARKLEKGFYFRRFDTEAFAKKKKCSVQEAARYLRYEWFAELEKETGAQHTLVAHHADDNIESVLMNFLRGTGLRGLTGIPETNVYSVHIVRPLLNFRRKELFNYATTNHLEWIEDSSNASNDYTRNFFRNELLPAIRQVYPAVEENLLANIKRFKKVLPVYTEAVGKLRCKLVEEINGQLRVPVKKLAQYQQTAMPYEIFKEFGFNESQSEEIMRLTNAQTGKYVENEKWQVIRHRDVLLISPRSAGTEMVVVNEENELVAYPGGELQFSTVPASQWTLSPEAGTAQLDASLVRFPLILRKWKQGDYFYPLGLRKKKKIARFFIDQKMSKADKENAWVIESDQRIIWVVGMRIDDRFKVTPSSSKILVIRSGQTPM